MAKGIKKNTPGSIDDRHQTPESRDRASNSINRRDDAVQVPINSDIPIPKGKKVFESTVGKGSSKK